MLNMRHLQPCRLEIVPLRDVQVDRQTARFVNKEACMVNNVVAVAQINNNVVVVATSLDYNNRDRYFFIIFICLLLS